MAFTTKTSVISIGTGKFYLADYSATPLASTWTELFQTLKDSVKLEQADGDTVEVYTDQNSLPIYSVKKSGKFTLTFQIPNLSTALLALFFNTATTASGSAPAGFELVDMKMDLKAVNKMIKMEVGSDQVWIFNNLTISRKLTGSTLSTAPMIIEVTAEVTANPDPTKSDFIILNRMDGVA